MGLEPMTSSLPRKCSTTELQQRIDKKRVKGIEPSQPAWKAGALPLSYTRGSESWSPLIQQTQYLFCISLNLYCDLSGETRLNRFTLHFSRMGGYRIRTCVGVANGFTVRPL